MKKLALFLFCFACIAAMLFTGCVTPSPIIPEATEEPFSVLDAEIKEAAHQREEGFSSYFKTHAIDTPLFTVHMEDAVYEESALRAAAEKLLKDAETIFERTGEKLDPDNVFIIGKRLSGNKAAIGANAFITKDELDSGDYRKPLITAGMGLEAEWQRTGLLAYVFGGSCDESGLKEYYSDENNILTASCSPLFLEPEVAGEEISAYAKKTAESLAAFIIDGEGFEAFRKAADTASHLDAWFKHIGAEGGSLPEGSERAAKLDLKTDRYYGCIIEVENFTVCVTKDGWTRDPAEIYSFICRLFTGCDRMKEKLLDELPFLSDLINERFSEPMAIEFADPEVSISYSEPKRNKVVLSVPSTIYHELIHLILEPGIDNSSMFWMTEGVAEYFSDDIMTGFYPTDHICNGLDHYLEFFEEVAGHGPAEDDMVFHRSVLALYNELAASEGADRDDSYAYELAYGISSMLLDGIERTQIRMKYDRSVAYGNTFFGHDGSSGPKEEDGLGLSYPQSLAMLVYLGKTYGMENVIGDYMKGLSVEDMTGKPYAELYGEAKEYYNELYGEFMDKAD